MATASTHTDPGGLRSATGGRVRRAGTGILALTTALVACAPTATALRSGFPDLTTFAEAPVDTYIATGPKGPRRFVQFSTPYNIDCVFTATLDPVPAGSSRGISCEGQFLDAAADPEATAVCATGSVASWGASGFRIATERSGCPYRAYHAGALLSAGQKVSYQHVTCAVGGDRLVACLDTSLGQHGFALKPSGNLTF